MVALALWPCGRRNEKNARLSPFVLRLFVLTRPPRAVAPGRSSLTRPVRPSLVRASPIAPHLPSPPPSQLLAAHTRTHQALLASLPSCPCPISSALLTQIVLRRSPLPLQAISLPFSTLSPTISWALVGVVTQQRHQLRRSSRTMPPSTRSPLLSPKQVHTPIRLSLPHTEPYEHREGCASRARERRLHFAFLSLLSDRSYCRSYGFSGLLACQIALLPVLTICT